MNEQLRDSVRQQVISQLTNEDDESFWFTAFDTIMSDIEALDPDAAKKQEIFVQIGACSHWRRPHQERWTAAGGFAWPEGYVQKYKDHTKNSWGPIGGGLPELDWFVLIHWNREQKKWQIVEPRFHGKKKLVLRAAFPTRTGRHQQAVIHSIWIPGTPGQPDKQATKFYGFRKKEQGWECVAVLQLGPRNLTMA